MAPPLARTCERHPQRRAIAVCVVTAQAICAECSTQYQGVNYSKEGLAQHLAEQRRRSGVKGHSWGMTALCWALAPLAVYLTWVGFEQAGQLLVDLMQADFGGGAS